MISCKSCEHMLIFKTEQTYDVNVQLHRIENKFLIFFSVHIKKLLLFSHLLILLTNIPFIKIWFWLFD